MMARNESSSYTLVAGISPFTILQNIQSDMQVVSNRLHEEASTSILYNQIDGLGFSANAPNQTRRYRSI